MLCDSGLMHPEPLTLKQATVDLYICRRHSNTQKQFLLHLKGHAQENKCKKAKWLSEEALQIAEKRRDTKVNGKKRKKDSHLNPALQRLARRDKKVFLSDQCKKKKKKRENNRMEKK